HRHIFLSLLQICSSILFPRLHPGFLPVLRVQDPDTESLYRGPSSYHIHIYLLRIVPLLLRWHLHQPLPLLPVCLRQVRLQRLQPTRLLPLPCPRSGPSPHGCPDSSICHTPPGSSEQSLSAYPDFHPSRR